MTYRIVDVATNAQVGSEMVGEGESALNHARCKASMLAHIAGGSFRVDVWNGLEWHAGPTMTEAVA